jgi:hypothetical protein
MGEPDSTEDGMSGSSWKDGLRRGLLVLGVLWVLALPLHNHVRGPLAIAATAAVSPLAS